MFGKYLVIYGGVSEPELNNRNYSTMALNDINFYDIEENKFIILGKKLIFQDNLLFSFEWENSKVKMGCNNV